MGRGERCETHWSIGALVTTCAKRTEADGGVTRFNTDVTAPEHGRDYGALAADFRSDGQSLIVRFSSVVAVASLTTKICLEAMAGFIN